MKMLAMIADAMRGGGRWLVVAMVVCVAVAANAQSTWTGDTSADWGVAGNWDGGVPGTSDTALFTSTSGSGYSIHLGSANRQIASLTLDATTGGTPYTINLYDSDLTTSRELRTQNITVSAENHTISGAKPGSGTDGTLRLENTTFNIASGALLMLDTRVRAHSNTNNYEKTGEGTLVFNADNGGSNGWNFSSGTTGFTVSEGILRFAATRIVGNTQNRFSISSGAALELVGGIEQDIRDAGRITLNGDGIGSTGALRSLSGNNRLHNSGRVVLASDTSIGVDGDTLRIEMVVKEDGGARSLTKVGAGTLQLEEDNTYTGATIVNAGTLSLLGSLDSGSALEVGGGTFSYGGSAAQTVNGLTVNSGVSVVNNTNTGDANVLNLGAITRNPGGIVNFANATAANNVITTTTANNNGILSPGARVGSDWAANDGSGNIVAYSGYTDVQRLTPGTIADDSTTNVRIVEGSGSVGNIALGSAVTIVNTLLQSASGGTSSATIDAASKTLRANGVMMAPTAGALTIGTAAGSGNLTVASSGGELILLNNSDNGMIINSVIANNSSASALTKSGSGTVILSGANTYTGATTINEGVLQIGDGDDTGTLGDDSDTTIATGATLLIERLVDTNQSIWGYNYEGELSGSGTVSIPSERRLNFLADQPDSGDLSFVVNGILGVSSDQSGVDEVRLGALSGAGTIQRAGPSGDGGTATIYIGGKGTDSVFTGRIRNPELGVEKVGAGTLTLAGSSSSDYGGATTISKGTLRVDTTLPSTPEVTVNHGGALAGEGTIGGDLTIEDGGTFLADGSVLTVDGDVTLDSGSILDASGINPVGDDPIEILSYGGTLTGTFSTIQVPVPWSVEYDEENKKILLVSGAQDMLVMHAGASVLPGATDMLPMFVNVPVHRTYVVTNLSEETTIELHGTPAVIFDGSSAAGFEVSANITGTATNLAPGESAAFTISFLSSDAGTYTGTVRIANSIEAQNPYEFDVVATDIPQVYLTKTQETWPHLDGWEDGEYWSDDKPAGVGKHYLVASGRRVFTPSGSSAQTFPGDSLTLGDDSSSGRLVLSRTPSVGPRTTFIDNLQVVDGILHTTNYDTLHTLQTGTGIISIEKRVRFQARSTEKDTAGIIVDAALTGENVSILVQAHPDHPSVPNQVQLIRANPVSGTIRSYDYCNLIVNHTNALQNLTMNRQSGDTGIVTFNQNSTVGGLMGAANISFGGYVVSVGNNNADTTYSGEISDGSLTKIGTGELTLSGASTYTGATIVEAGTLRVNGSLHAGSEVTVQNDAALAGEGTINGDLTIADGGTFLADGGALEVGGEVTLGAGTVLDASGVPNRALVLVMSYTAESRTDEFATIIFPDEWSTDRRVVYDFEFNGKTYIALRHTPPAVFRFR